MSLLWIAAILSQTVAQKCFLPVSSTVPRRVINTIKVTSAAGCNVMCADDAQCEACSFNAGTGMCTILGAIVASGTCSAPQTIYEKRTTTDCKVIPQPFSVKGGEYTAGQCSSKGDTVGEPDLRSSPPCGVFSDGNRRIVFDAIMHNGTHVTFENYRTNALVDWDGYLGSWFYHVGEKDYYFHSGACVRPPAKPLPGCHCTPLPTQTPTAGFRDAGVAPVMGVAPVCPNLVQLLLRRAVFNGVEVEVVTTVGRAIYCVMGTWMNIKEADDRYLEYTVSAATCVEPV